VIRRVAVHAVTRGGAALGARVAAALGAELFVGSSAAPAAEAAPGARVFPLPMRAALAKVFRAYDGHVIVLAVGATLRLVAPLLDGKRTDPAVVCLDETGRFAVALLSGHAGGANALAAEVASAVGAMPVITTASDSLGTLRVDLLGAELGWTMEDPGGQATRVAAAVVNGDPVLMIDEAGGGRWAEGTPLPVHVVVTRSASEVDVSRFAGVIAITDRAAPGDPLLSRAVLWRPPTLALGVGCDRGAPAEAVDEAVANALRRAGLAEASVSSIATIDLKHDEAGIVALAGRLGRPLRLYRAEELDGVPGVESPSEVALRRVGTRSVAEAAALRAAGALRLLVPKQVHRHAASGRSVTVAVARVPREDG
jgi:cobalt-precorrin 5A hydrolase